MKRTIAVAGALLVGTSALALAPAKTVDGAWHDAGWESVDKTSFAPAAKFEPKPVDLSFGPSTRQEPGWRPDAGFKPVPATAWIDGGAAPAFGKADAADGKWQADGAKPAVDKTDAAHAAALDEHMPQAADAKMAALPVVDDQRAVHQGVGGPDEPAPGKVTAADLTPRPATHNYPPCDPGPGDDNCIQLYEPGVRMALASWNRETGGLTDHSATTAMGGPYEPVGKEAVETADAADVAARAEPAAADLEGTGGPASETGYPPCSGSPGDDRCIQLYERGVTGKGN